MYPIQFRISNFKYLWLGFSAVKIHFFQIGDRRLEIQLGQLNVVSPAFFLYSRYLAVFIHDIPEGNRIGRTGLLASRLNFTIFHIPSMVFGQISHLPDSLLTETAFFHHPFEAN